MAASTQSTPLSSISLKSLSSPYSLHSSSPCPTRDLTALTSSVPSTSQQKLTLLRTTGNSDTVWDWTPTPPAPAGGAGLMGAGRFGANKGKAKVVPGLEGDIKGLCWDPLGNYIALALSSPTTSSFTLLSVHTGKSPLPPIVLPSSSKSISSLSWHPLKTHEDPLLHSYATELISKLPKIPSSTSGENDPPSSSSSTTALPGGGGGMVGAFGNAKNLALMREREKEGGRDLDLQTSAKGLPTLLPEDDTVGDAKEEEDSQSLLAIGDEGGVAYLYLGGSVYLGSLPLSPTHSTLLLSTLIPTPSTPTISLSFLLSSSSSALSLTTSQITLPRSLEIFSQQSTALRENLGYAFKGVQKVKKSWEESRRLAKVWLGRLGENTKNHGHSQPPISQLLSLLMTGRATTALTDLFASKMTSKLLLKWESTTAEALAELKKTLFVEITPAVERVVLLLDEMRAWRDWKEKFSTFRLDEGPTGPWLDRTIQVAKEVIKQSDALEFLVLEEERCFQSFSFWLKYELDKVALAEGSDVRPMARYQPIPVAHFIRHCLPESSITPYLNFGPSSSPLESNPELKEVETWYASPLNKEKEEAEREGMEATLESTTKRMKEELKGQLDLELVQESLAHHAHQPFDDVMNVERPPRVDDKTGGGKVGKVLSIPILCHLLAGRVAAGLKEAIRTVGGGAVRGAEIGLGEVTKNEEGTVFVRERVVGEGDEAKLYCAWAGPNQLCISRKLASSTHAAVTRFDLALPDGHRTNVVDFDFLDDEEIVLAVGTPGTDRTSYHLIGVRFAQIDFSLLTGATLPISRSHPLDGDFPPERIALNGRKGRRIIAVLSAEGRRVETLDVDPDAEDEEVEVDEMMAE